MNTPTIPSTNGPKPPESYELMLKESIDHFLILHQKGFSDFSSFSSIFFRLFQTMANPPLETVWFYSAVTFHTSKQVCSDPLKKILVAKDLFHLLVSCSSACNGFKRVAVLAPVVYVLYNLSKEFWNRELWSKREIEGLVDEIVTYITVCCYEKLEEPENGLENMTANFPGLIRVWTVDGVGGSCEFKDDLRLFFPLVSEDFRRGIDVGCGVHFLAQIVMSQAFLLKLCLKLDLGVSREELCRDMRIWSVQTINCFHNCYFFDMLLRMLLEPILPVATLLVSMLVLLISLGAVPWIHEI